ncbi:MAG TPA: transcriptional regulator [Pseudonocardiaceae bacterium]
MSLLPTGLPDLGASPATAARLRVDRESLPKLRRVFNDALAKLDVQINEAITAVRVSPWAGDPVSENAASRFNDHSINDADSALNVLMAYQQRLKSASDALEVVAQQYQDVEDGNTATLRALENSD